MIHLAARVGGITANLQSPADFLVDNLQIDTSVLGALRLEPPKHLISMLSTCMYPDELSDLQYPMTEDLIEAGPPPPTNASYAAAKRALWHGTIALHDQYGVPYTALIPANLYGPGDHFGTQSSHFLAAAIDKIERARVAQQPRVSFFGTGRALRQYVLVDDLAGLIALIATRPPLNRSINVAPTESRSIKDLTDLVSRAAGYEGTISFTGSGPDGQLRKDVDSTLLTTLVPEWARIETDLEEGIAMTLDWYRDHVATG